MKKSYSLSIMLVILGGIFINGSSVRADEGTSLWDIENENQVKTDADNKTSDEVTETGDNSLDQQNPNLHPDLIRPAYDKEVSKGKIDPIKNTFTMYERNYKKAFNDFLNLRDMEPGLTYTEWYEKACNNGASADGIGYTPKNGTPDADGLIRTTRAPTPGQAASAQRFRQNIKKGDIVTVTTGAMGHAAIATTDNYLLEMTGGGDLSNWFNGSLKSNNNQYVIEDWLFGGKWAPHDWLAKNEIQNHLQIWRLNSASAAHQAADYADSHYFNPNHGGNKTIDITYTLDPRLFRQNPNYCSKLVFQAFWYGTGNTSVVLPGFGASSANYIYPYSLPNIFGNGYSAHKVGDF